MHSALLLTRNLGGTALELIVIVMHLASHHDLIATGSRCMGGVLWVLNVKLVSLCRWMTAAEMTIDL